MYVKIVTMRVSRFHTSVKYFCEKILKHEFAEGLKLERGARKRYERCEVCEDD